MCLLFNGILIVLLLFSFLLIYKVYVKKLYLNALIKDWKDASHSLQKSVFTLSHKKMILDIMLRLYLNGGDKIESDFTAYLEVCTEFNHNISLVDSEFISNAIQDDGAFNLNEFISSNNYTFLLKVLEHCKDEEVNKLLKPYLSNN